MHRALIALLPALALSAPIGASWSFDGAATARLDYGDLPVVTLGPQGAFSCFITMRLDPAEAGEDFLIGKHSAAGSGWKMYAAPATTGPDTARRVTFRVSGGHDAVTEQTAIIDDITSEWHTVGGSFSWPAAPDGSAMALYLDGAAPTEPPTLNAAQPPTEHADPFTVGGDAFDPSVTMNGRIGHAAVWDDVALSTAEHALLAAGADPRTVRPEALVFYARLEDERAVDTIGERLPVPGMGAAFDVDRWPASRPFISALGDVTPTSIKVLSHAGRSAAHVVEYATDASFETATTTAALSSNEASDFVVVHTLTNLVPDTEYHYRIRVDGRVVANSTATFHTAPAGDAAFRFVYSSCTEYDDYVAPYPRYSHATLGGVAARSPLFAVHSGDVWYSDHGGSDAETFFDAWTMNTVEAFNRKVTQLFAERDVAKFIRRFPMYMMPDDHEFKNNVDASLRSADPASPWQRALARVMHWQFSKNPPRHPNAVAANGLWYTFTAGGVDFFFIDMRTQRGFNGAPGSGTMLGNTSGALDGQLGDLLAWIDASTAPFKVILAPSMLSDRGTTWSDSWQAAFPDDQQQVIDALARRRDIVYFAGDVHWSGAIRLAASPTGDPAHDLYEFVGGTYGGHLSNPPDPAPDDVLMVYDGRTVTPNRFSYLVVDVDTTVDPETMHVSIVSHDPCDGSETIEYAHSPILSEGGCRADFDRDGAVAFADVLSLLAVWGPCAACEQDLNDSATVDFADVLALLAAWGACPS